jgi:hypothetical protein
MKNPTAWVLPGAYVFVHPKLQDATHVSNTSAGGSAKKSSPSVQYAAETKVGTSRLGACQPIANNFRSSSTSDWEWQFALVRAISAGGAAAQYSFSQSQSEENVVESSWHASEIRIRQEI